MIELTHASACPKTCATDPRGTDGTDTPAPLPAALQPPAPQPAAPQPAALQPVPPQPVPRRSARRPGPAFPRPPSVAVYGPGRCTRREYDQARRLGQLLARRHAVVLCGDDAGVTEALETGARPEGGTVVRVNRITSADAVIVVGGSWRALGEAATAIRGDAADVITLDGWMLLDRAGRPVPGVRPADSADAAVELALGAALAGGAVVDA